MSTARSTGTNSRTARVLVIVSAVLLALSTATATAFGVSWAVAATDDSIDLAKTRDEALQDGRQALINFNTLDYRHVQRGLDRWEQSSTGTLHESVVKYRKKRAEIIKKAKAKTTAEIVAAGLTQLNARAGKARMIAVVELTVTPKGKEPRNKTLRYEAELTRVKDKTWKLSKLGPFQGSRR